MRSICPICPSSDLFQVAIELGLIQFRLDAFKQPGLFLVFPSLLVVGFGWQWLAEDCMCLNGSTLGCSASFSQSLERRACPSVAILWLRGESLPLFLEVSVNGDTQKYGYGKEHDAPVAFCFLGHGSFFDLVKTPTGKMRHR